MSRQAQAEREKQARVILGSAEAAIAGKFVEAANIYAGHPEALQLRAMNIIYETTKERGATILMPSSMVDSMNPYGNTPVSYTHLDVYKRQITRMGRTIRWRSRSRACLLYTSRCV